VSIVCSNALSRSIHEFALTDPGNILDQTRKLVVETFDKSGQNVRDGMDISLLVKNKNTGQLSWSGANNPLWILKSNEIIEIKGDKQPIGKSDQTKPFSTHIITTSSPFSIYLPTDGFADQFGGPKGKKFKYASLKNLFCSIADKSMSKQKEIIETTFENWRNDLEQVDDVCIIGVRL